MEYLHPDFKNGDESRMKTDVLFLSLRWPVGTRRFLVAEVPYSYYRYEADYGFFSYAETQRALGNPYAGLEIGSKNKTIFGELGMRRKILAGYLCGSSSGQEHEGRGQQCAGNSTGL